MTAINKASLNSIVHEIVAMQPVTDLHTHVFSPQFGVSPQKNAGLLWGIDDLLTYHYLIAEVFRVVPATKLSYDDFYAMTSSQQADHIWLHLFVNRTPISEACRGIITTLTKLGLNPHEKNLTAYRNFFASLNADKYIDKVMEIANVDMITMTNEVFDLHERNLWLENDSLNNDPRFQSVLRIDKLLLDWKAACDDLFSLGYCVKLDANPETINEVKKFLHDWIDRMNPIYVATSLPPTFQYTADETCMTQRLITQGLLPVLEKRNLPWAMMIGAVRGTNPSLRAAGDSLGSSDVNAVANLCRTYPKNKFMVTLLSRENQHEITVIARKFGNLLPFGCWWYLNNPSLIKEMTQMRLELLGTTFTPQHSDARVLDQLIYKWDHSRKIIADVLVEKYQDLIDSGYTLTKKMIQADIKLLLRDTYRQFVGLPTD